QPSKNSSSYFSFGWAYYRGCKLLNTVCSEKEVVTIFLSQPFFHGLLLEYSKFFLVTHGISC
ncbi:MAG: hypothetical protein ACLTHE_10715, partial [Enterococcus faecium]